MDVNLTLNLTDYVKTDDLTDYVKKDDAIFDDYVLKDAATFTGTTTIDTLAIADSGTTILGVDNQFILIILMVIMVFISIIIRIFM